MVKSAHWLFDQKHKGETLLFSLFLLFLPTQFGKHFWPSFSYLLGIRSDYLSPTIYFSDILVIGLFGIWLWKEKKKIITILVRAKRDASGKLVPMWESIVENLLVYTSPRALARSLGRRRLATVSLIICVFIYLLINVLFSNNILLGLYGLWKVVECLFIGFYIAKRSAKIISVPQAIFFLSLGAIFESILAIAQFVNQGSLNGILYFFGERAFTSQTIGIADMSLHGTELVRPYATFPHPNVLAGYLLVISTLLLFAFWKRYTPFFISHVYFLFSYFVCSFALLLTYGRVAIICWVLTIGAFIFIQLKNKQKRNTIIITSLFILLVFLFALHFQLFQRFSSLTLSDESVTQREILLTVSLQLLTSHLWVGVGLNNFLPALSQLPVMQLNFFLLQPVHNIFALVAVETGIIGLGIFLTLFVMTFLSLYKMILTNKTKAYVLCCLVCLLQIVITGLFDHYWLTLQQGQLLLSVVMGFCWAKQK